MNVSRYKVSGWMVLYIAMALFWLYMAYTEMTSKEEAEEVPQAQEVESSLAETTGA